MRKVIRENVAKSGDVIFEYSDAENLQSQFEKHQPDWILMDIQMKSINGIKASEELKKQHPEAKIIIVTNFDEPQYRKMAARSGVSGFVLKDSLETIGAIIDPQGNDTKELLIQ